MQDHEKEATKPSAELTKNFTSIKATPTVCKYISISIYINISISAYRISVEFSETLAAEL